MSDSSNATERDRDFVGAYVDPATKKRVERQAEQEGKTISDVVRRRLSDNEDENQ
jgi:hypothetical protein